jgi:hypothetical protein
MRRRALLVAVGFLTALILQIPSGTVWAAANWTVGLKSGSSGEAKAQALPAAPAATSACASPTSSREVTVTWAAITHATNYGVYQSTTSATGTYTLTATVTTATWTSAALAAGHYWYEVVANIGTNWASARSAATAERTTTSTTCS